MVPDGITPANESEPMVIALTRGKTGTYASVNGAAVKKLMLGPGKVSGTALATKLDLLAKGALATVLIIGTKADGTPGWDDLDDTELTDATKHAVAFISEGQALHRAHTGGGVAGYIILATAVRDGSVAGSARWWVQDGDKVKSVDIKYLGGDYGKLYIIAGESLATTPSMVAVMAEAFLAAHPDVTHLYLWSQDGLEGFKAYQPEGFFWKTIELPKGFTQNGGCISVIPTAFTIMLLASQPLAASEIKDATSDESDKADAGA